MRRHIKAISFLMVLGAANVASALTIRIYNADSKSHTIEYKCNGSAYKKTVRASATGSYTLHSTATKCAVTGGTVSFPNATLSSGDKYTIRSGKATPGT